MDFDSLLSGRAGHDKPMKSGAEDEQTSPPELQPGATPAALAVNANDDTQGASEIVRLT